MTDRVRTLTVILDQKMRVDDVAYVVEAIRMIRYVAEVQLGPVSDANEYAVRMEERRRLEQALLKVLNDDK